MFSFSTHCYYPHTMRESVSAVCRIFFKGRIYKSVLLGQYGYVSQSKTLFSKLLSSEYLMVGKPRHIVPRWADKQKKREHKTLSCPRPVVELGVHAGTVEGSRRSRVNDACGNTPGFQNGVELWLLTKTKRGLPTFDSLISFWATLTFIRSHLCLPDFQDVSYAT